MKEIINTNNAPSAIGPYSQAVMAGDTIYISGQLPIDPKTGEFAGDDVTTQTKQALENMKAILESVGLTMNNVVKTTVLLKNIGDFVAMNEVYATFFTQDFPARAAYEVAALPKAALVEIEAIAYKG